MFPAITSVESKIYIALSNGDVVEQPGVDKGNSKILYHVMTSANQVTSISVDWFTNNVYLAAGDKVGFLEWSW